MFSMDTLLSLLAPHECLECGQEGTLLCDLCRHDQLAPVPDRCYRCLAKTRDSAVCVKCRHDSNLKYVWVGTEYEGIAKDLIKQLKFERARSAYVPIAKHIADTLPFLPPETVITYIPTATSRHRTRGYDQSRLIAKEVAKLKGVRFRPIFERRGQTRQVGSTRKQRIAQASDMFRLLKNPPLNSQVIIIDDIVTTGASLEAAASLLKKAGVNQVSAAVFAQKQ